MKPDGLTPRLFLRDSAAFCLLAAVSLGTGLLLNLGRNHPLPLRYLSRADRLESAVHAVSSPALPATDTKAGQAREIDLEEFQQFVAENKGQVLDARSQAFYRLGHVPGALNLSREEFARDFAALEPVLKAHAGQPIAVYCSEADCQDSQLVANALLKLGYKSVLVYREGWAQWQQAGLPQEPPAKDGK